MAGIAVLAIAAIAWFSRSPQEATTDITVKPTQGSFEVVVTTSGELRAKRSTEILGPRRARDLRIRQMTINWLIPEGTVVKEGQLVARLDQGELLNQMEDVKIALETAQTELTTTKLDTALSLSKSRNNIINLKYDVDERLAEMEQAKFEAPATQQKAKISYQKAERSYEQAKANYKKEVAQARAQVRTKQLSVNKAQNQLNDYIELQGQFTVLAPADGMVIYDREWDGRKVATGSSIGAWNPVVATLPDLTEMESITYVNEIDIQKIEKGQEVIIGLDAVAGKELGGKVVSVANIGEKRPNSDAKVFEVLIEVHGKDTTLRPAMTTSNQIVVADKESSLSIPLECLHTQDSTSFVFIKTGSKTVKQQVKTGLINENNAEVVEGISLEDELFLTLPEDTTGLLLNKLIP